MTPSATALLEHVRAIDLFDAWLFEESAAEMALIAWQSAPVEDRGEAFAVYVAALDREQQAAVTLERALAPRRWRDAEVAA
jgi:hypothetical protein